MSLNTYLQAAWAEGRAPLDPRELIDPEELPNVDPNKVIIVCTGSQVRSRLANVL